MARRLLFLNGLATFGLVLNHASSWVFTAMFWWAHRYRDVPVPNFDAIGSPSYWVLRLVEQLIAFTVPAFLFVSGYFIAFATGREPLVARWAGVGRRLGTLLIPYLVWSTVLLLEPFLRGERETPARYLKIFLTGRASDPYYYIPLLAQCLVLAPLLIEAGRRHWKALLIAAGLVQLSVQAVRYPMTLDVASPAIRTLSYGTPNWFVASKIFWFTFGVVVGLHLESFQKFVSRHHRRFAVLAVGLVPIGIWEWERLLGAAPGDWIGYFDTLLDSVYAAAFILAFMGLTISRGWVAERIEEIGSRSYGVFLVHSVVLVYTARLLYTVAPGVLAYPLVLFAILVVVGLGVPLAAMNAVKQSPLRGIYRYIFG